MILDREVNVIKKGTKMGEGMEYQETILYEVPNLKEGAFNKVSTNIMKYLKIFGIEKKVLF